MMNLRTVFIFLVLSCSSYAKTIYVTQFGSGDESGSSTANSWSMSQLNTAANWGAGLGKISAGDIVSLNGLLTSPFNVQGSGTSSNPITIQFADQANFSMATWTAGVINITNQSYVTIDGGSNGFIEATGNGERLNYQNDLTGVLTNGCDHIVVKNLKILNLYVRASGDTGAKSVGIRFGGIGSGCVVSNCKISYCVFGISVVYSTPGIAGFVVDGCNVSYCGASVVIGSGNGNGSISDVTVKNSTFDNWSVWYDSADKVHADGIHAFAYSGAKIARLYVYNNTFGPDMGDHATGAIFCESSTSADYTDTRVFNNVFLIKSSNWSDGCIAYSNGSPSNLLVANNTFSNSTIWGKAIYVGGGTGLVFENNIMVGGSKAVYWDTAPTGYTSNYNITYGNKNGTNTKEGPNSSSTDPNLNGLYVSQLFTFAATNLSTYFSTDKNGALRPTSGQWSAGAYQGSDTKTLAPANAQINIAIQ